MFVNCSTVRVGPSLNTNSCTLSKNKCTLSQYKQRKQDRRLFSQYIKARHGKFHSRGKFPCVRQYLYRYNIIKFSTYLLARARGGRLTHKLCVQSGHVVHLINNIYFLYKVEIHRHSKLV